MLDGKAYQSHFPDDPAYEASSLPIVPSPPLSLELIAALAALERDLRPILEAARAE
jgi:hypothetical protein